MLYCTKLSSVNPGNIKKAFSLLIKRGMPIFPIVRCDRDKSINKLANTYFASKGILLLSRRSKHHMGFLEGIIRSLKKKFMKNLRYNKNGKKWTEKRLEKALADVVYSYNHSVSSSHGMTPASCNYPEFDPELRLRLYGERKLQRFEDFYEETLNLHRRANTPRKSSSKPNYSEKPDSFKKSDLVYIDFEPPRAGRSAYNVQHGPIHIISRVNVQASPFLYKLKNISTGRELHGWFYGRELASAELSDLEIERVEKQKTTKDKRKLIYVKYKGLDSSFNRWIEKT